jgi:hypothetical protein
MFPSECHDCVNRIVHDYDVKAILIAWAFVLFFVVIIFRSPD